MQLAVDAAQRGDTKTAAAHYERCLRISRDLGLSAYEAIFIRRLEDLALSTGDLDHAQDLLQQATATFTRVGSPLGVALSRLALAAVAARRGDSAHARTIYQDILANLRHGERADVTAMILARLGFLAERDCDLAEGRARHQDSLELAADVGHPSAIALALEGLAGIAAAVGEPARAAQLLAGATSLRQRSGVPVDDIDRDDVDRVFDRTRSALSPAAFDAAYTAGQSLTLPESPRTRTQRRLPVT